MENNVINTDFADVFKLRTKKNAVSIIKFLRTIKSNDEIAVIKNQLIRCSTSVAANYRAACRGRSKAEFISNLGVVHEETDKVLFWLELLSDFEYSSPELQKLLKESDEILGIVAKSVATARANLVNNKKEIISKN